jgi:hypothetical protein
MLYLNLVRYQSYLLCTVKLKRRTTWNFLVTHASMLKGWSTRRLPRFTRKACSFV